MIPTKQTAPDQSAFTTTRIAPSASVSGDGLVKHALNLRAIRASKEGQFIDRNSGKSPLFSAWLTASSRSVATRYAVNAGQESPAIYSRDFPRLPFTPASVNLGASRRSSQLGRIAFGLADPFGKLAGKGVAAPFARIFKVSPSRTMRASSPIVLKPMSLSLSFV